MNRVEEEKQFEILTVNRYEVEENAVFLDYDTAKLLEFIDKYSEMKFHLRLSLAKNLKSVEQALADHPQQFASLMEKLVLFD